MKLTKNLIKREVTHAAASNDSVYEWVIELGRRGDPLLDPATMTAAEQMFFLGAPLAHVVAFAEELKRARLLAAHSSRPALARLR